MRWIDEATSTCARAWSKGDVAAVYSGSIHFYKPIHIGDLVEVESRLIHTTERSMHFSIHVRSGPPTTGQLELTTLCMSVFVSVGPDGRAQAVPQFVPTTEEDVQLDAHAKQLIRMRNELRSISLDPFGPTDR